MKFVSVFLFLLFSSTLQSQVEELRSLYFGARNAQAISAFYNKANNQNNTDPLSLAYKGVATAMYAEVAEDVSQKLAFFNQGKDILEGAVAKDWYNAEIRFLRFSVQSKAPFFLGYRSKMEEDVYVILDAMEKRYIDMTSSFWKNAIIFLNNSDELSSDQENRLKKIANT